jgi:uncharacterized membrane protein required for colicin V production
MTLDLHNLNTVDIIALVLLAVGAFQGLRRGLSGELARLVGVVIAFLAGVRFHEPVAAWCIEHTRLDYWPARTLAFTLTIAVGMAVMILVRLVLGRVIQIVIAEGLNRLGGILAGTVRSAVMILVVFLVVNMLTPDSFLGHAFGDDSAIGRVVRRYVPLVRDRLHGKWEQLDDEREEPRDE